MATRAVTLQVNIQTNATQAQAAFKGISKDLEAAQDRLHKLNLQIANPRLIEQQATADRHVANAQLAVDAVKAKMQAAHYATPYGKRELWGEAATNSAKSVSQLRVETMRAQASAAHAATPAGHAAVRQRRDLLAAKGAANLAQKQEENVAAYGKLGGGLRNTRDSMVRMASAAGPLVAGLAGATAAAYGMAAAASPSAAKTLTSSMELLAARMGHSLVPGLEALSKAAQDASNAWQQFAQTRVGGKQVGNIIGDAVGGTVRSAVGSWADLFSERWAGHLLDIAANPINPIYAGMTGKTVGEQLNKWLGVKDSATTSDLDLPMTAKTFSGQGGFSQFEMGLQSSALNAGANQTQMQVLQEVLKELMRSNQLVSQVTQNSNEAKGVPPAFG